ncbi:MAG: F0F1 ATP synthase subunit B [Anaerolineae bacterium]|nr:F0F1 ATP synthase subunit B [Anaerolineae bacterium]
MERLGINGGFLIAQIINFVIVFGVLSLAWRPLVRALEARREKIAKGLEDARAAELARANAERDAQKYIDEQRTAAQRLVEEGRSRAEDQARVVLEEARREAEAIRVKARQDSEEERNASLSEVRSQVAQIAIAAAERVIGQSLDDKKSKSIINDFFTSIPAGASNLGANVEVTSAMPLNDEEKKYVAQQIGASNPNFRVDPNILGGLVIRAGDRVIDGSVRSNLGKLAASIG